MLSPSPASESEAAVEGRRRELQELRRRLADLKSRYAATRRKEADLAATLAAADLNLQIQTAERRVLELRRQETERDLALATSLRDEAARSLASTQLDLSRRLSALYRLGRLGYFRTLVTASSAPGFLHGLLVLAHLARRDATLLARYREAVASLGQRESDLSARRKELASLAADSRRKEAELAAARKEQARLLAQVRQSSETERVAVSALQEKSDRLAALLDLLEEHGRVLPPGAASIRNYRGALDWPLKGRVAVPFGRIANPNFPGTFLRSNGWTIEAAPGTPVRAIFAGEAVYARWLKGYDNIVVLDHGDGVFTLYGRLATGTVPRGDHVALGDKVGVVGENLEGEEPGLYFEIRDNRASADPANWLR